MKKIILSLFSIASSMVAIGQAKMWSLIPTYMDCMTELSTSPTMSSVPLNFYESDASSFPISGKCNTYCKIEKMPAGGVLVDYYITHLTEGVSPSLPGYTSGKFKLNIGVTTRERQSSVAVGRKNNYGDRDIYAWTLWNVHKVGVIERDGSVTGAPQVLYTSPGLTPPQFDAWSEMEVGADNRYLIFGGPNANSVYMFDLVTNTPLIWPSPGGPNSIINGYEYEATSRRLYISYVNPTALTGGIGYYDLNAFILTFVNVSFDYRFGYSEIEYAKNGKLYVAYNGAGTNNFTTAGNVYSIDIPTSIMTATTYSVPAVNNVLYAASCNKYLIQTQIDGEDYESGSYITHDIIASSTKMYFETAGGAQTLTTTPSSAPTFLTCGEDALFFTTQIKGMPQGYTIKVTKGSILPTNVFVRAGGDDTKTFWRPNQSASTIDIAFLYKTSMARPWEMVPISYINEDLEIEVISNDVCSNTVSKKFYVKIRPVDFPFDIEKMRATSAATISGKMSTTPVTTSPPTTNSSLALFKQNIDLAVGWMGANTAGVGGLTLPSSLEGNIKVYQADNTGARLVIGSNIAPNIIDLDFDSDIIESGFYFNYSTLAFDASLPPFYVDVTSEPGDGLFFRDFYEAALFGDIPMTLSEYSDLHFCIEATVTEKTSTRCQYIKKYYFRIANNGAFTNGRNGKMVDEEEEANGVNVPLISPNPFSTFLNLYIPSLEMFERFEVYDLSGRLVYENRQLNQGVNTIDLQELSSAVYFYKVIYKNETISGKVIKQ
jgi:hypothetical protein